MATTTHIESTGSGSQPIIGIIGMGDVSRYTIGPGLACYYHRWVTGCNLPVDKFINGLQLTR
jgi:hypothetical protein